MLADTPEAAAQGVISVGGGAIDDPSDPNPTLRSREAGARPWMRWPEGDPMPERR